MKIRSQIELNEAIDETLSWRKKELILCRTEVQRNLKNNNLESFIRFGIVAHYAHWEGYVIDLSKYFLMYLQSKSIQYKMLNKKLWALELEKGIKNYTQSKKSSLLVALANTLEVIEEMTISKTLVENINSKSNLNSEVLKNIMTSLALDYIYFELFEKFIDESLLKNRNEIAHGKRHSISSEHFFQIHENLIVLMNLYKNTIEINVSNEEYKVA